MSGIGNLYLVATPIGNLKDMSFRGLEILRMVDLIACEDTRHTRKLLSHYSIDAGSRLISIPSHDEQRRSEQILSRLQKGENVAFVTDAGMPGISDPGSATIRRVLSAGAKIIPVPGPSAHVAAVASSGFSSAQFCFLGFMPRKEKDIDRLLDLYINLPCLIVFHESPHRIAKTLSFIANKLGTERKAVLCREITKLHEEIVHGSLGFLAGKFSEGSVGEITVVIDAPDIQSMRKSLISTAEALDIIEEKVRNGMKMKEACKVLASEMNTDARSLYRLMLKRSG